MRRRRANTFTAVSDFLLALNNVIFILFIFAIVSMALKVQTEAGVKLKAEYVITAEWSLDYDCDVDLYVRDPNGNVAYWMHKEAGALSLDHDSQGSQTDRHTNSDGSITNVRSYMEIITMRGVVGGEYTVNLHLYSARINKEINRDLGRPYTVPVEVKIMKLNPTVEIKYDKTTTLDRIWEEKTVTRFTVDSAGAWLGADPTPMKLIQ